MEALHKRLSMHTILVVEDDPSTLKWLVRVLKIYFKEVYSATNAMDALEIFTQTPTDIIVADIQMPEVDGLSFLHKISVISPQTLRVVMTAFNSQPYLNRAVESGVHLYLKKPIDIDELLVALSSHMPESISIPTISNLGEGFHYDSDKKMVYKEIQAVKLTKKELLLLELLIKNRQGVVGLEMIEQNLYDEPVSDDAIRMVVVGLRKKLYPSLVENLKGLGYRLNLS
ncbi:MAG: DNA-binding response OmpR family regulator [Sulfurimonas sp.]|jgi:DNA-binding response OmpR family regulator|uniref:response regulator n=1 Tax=Sulfurimonas sp. TaxID=2022749 RepID=UPI0039E2EFA5